MQYILEHGVCHGTVFNSCHTSSAAEKNPLTEIQEGELYLCLEHRTVRVRERMIPSPIRRSPVRMDCGVFGFDKV